MKLVLTKLHLSLKRSVEVIPFTSFYYFYGSIGSGKSSIGRLVDHCLGATIPWTPALQQEFVSARLDLTVGKVPLTLQRDRDSNIVIASWEDGQETLQVALPARVAAGEVLQDTGVAVLSDLLFYLANEQPPRVRRRKGRPDERLERLSFRDLYRFCYLDQEGMDSDFFKLKSDNYFVAQKSVDVLRYVLGYQTEQVAELESNLKDLREERQALLSGAEALDKALMEAGFDNIVAVDAHVEQLHGEIDLARKAALASRQQRAPQTHAVDELRGQGRVLAQNLGAMEDALVELDNQIGDIERHLNELQMLGVRFQRTASARTLLAGVNFKSCPRCTQPLPVRALENCAVCGQPEHAVNADGALAADVVNQDLRSRQSELKETLQRMKASRRSLNAQLEDTRSEKASVDSGLAARLNEYDSAFLSRALESERTVVALEQKLNNLLNYRRLPDVLQEQRSRADRLILQEADVRGQLDSVRKAAFSDRKNIQTFGTIFLDCLVRCQFPDVRSTYHVEIDPASFYPVIPLGSSEALVELSFDNAGSGGMMALFRACYAIALHRLCARIGGNRLPSVLVIDTATKNVSSVENPEVINAFYRLVYELAEGELRGIQFIIIDNEFNPVPQDLGLTINVRHMVKGDPANPPLVPYLSGDFT